jgi:hypothetical protein
MLKNLGTSVFLFGTLKRKALANRPPSCPDHSCNPAPNCFEMALQETPASGSFRILPESSALLRRPSRLPLRRALRNPALTRSWIEARSNSAMAPMIWNIRRPEGVVRSSWSRNDTKLTPTAARAATI